MKGNAVKRKPAYNPFSPQARALKVQEKQVKAKRWPRWWQVLLAILFGRFMGKNRQP